MRIRVAARIRRRLARALAVAEVREIVRQTADHMGVPSHLIYSPSLARPIVRARHAAIRTIAAELGISQASIGRLMGLDNTTVCYALGRTKRRREAAHG